jgi:hypothetical protein
MSCQPSIFLAAADKQVPSRFHLFFKKKWFQFLGYFFLSAVKTIAVKSSNGTLNDQKKEYVILKVQFGKEAKGNSLQGVKDFSSFP